MRSIWTDLLFLHGYLVQKDLLWQQDLAAEANTARDEPTLPSAKAAAMMAMDVPRDCCAQGG